LEVADVLDIAKDAITTLLLVSSPIMAVGLGVGLSVALFQALTSIQEMTLTFVPKILAIFASLLIFLPHMLTTMMEFMERMADRMTSLQ
jgi:flagellar biosynthetic protein FliQ